MANTSYAVSQTEIGLAYEAVRGTPEAPDFWAKVKSPQYKINETILEDDTLQGSMVSIYDATPGMRYDSHGWTTFPYLDVLPLYVLAELGSPDGLTSAPTNGTLQGDVAVGATTISSNQTAPAGSWITIGTGTNLETHYVKSVSGTTSPYTITLDYPAIYPHTHTATDGSAAVNGLTAHDFSLLNNAGTGNQPPSLTITDYDGDQWRQLAASQLDKFDLKIMPNKTMDLSVTFFSNASITPTPPTPSFSSAQFPPGFTTEVSIGGTQLKYVESIDLSLSRGVKPIEAFQGTQAYYQYFAGPLVATAKITVIEQSGAPELTQYIAGTQESFSFSFADRKSGYGARFQSSNAIFKSGELVRGKEWVESTLDLICLPTAADATAGGVSPINVSIGNAQTTTFST